MFERGPDRGIRAVKEKCAAKIELLTVKDLAARSSLGETGSAWVAQLVERVLGKDEVTGSIPVPGSSDYGGCELVAMEYGGWMKQQGKRI
jgi:hypothetical protein